MNADLFGKSPAGRLVRTMGNASAFVPHPLPPPITWTDELVAHLSTADRALGELAGIGRNLDNPYLLIRPFVRREAVLSSRIEGTRASLSDVYAYEIRQLSLFDEEVPGDVLEVVNYVRALEYGLRRLQTLPLSLRLVREMHAQLMSAVRGANLAPGEFRHVQNWIGPPGCTLESASFVPPPPPEMLEALGDLERFWHAPRPLPPLLEIALTHYQFEAIHPFLDGNGRIGRLLIILMLCQRGLLPQPLLYLSAYFEENPAAYYDALLKVSAEGRWTDWLIFFLRGVTTQARDAATRAGRLVRLHRRYRERLETARSPALLLRLVDEVLVQPLVTVRHVQGRLGVSFRTAQALINKLMEAGLLREVTGRARNRVYLAYEVLEAVDAPVTEER